jgi:hypothetical protein
MPSMVSTRGRPVPYITVAELKRAPIYGQLKQLVPNSSEADRDAELARIIARVTGMINGEVNQNLAATHDFEIGQVIVADTGDLRIHTRCSPIISVQSISVGTSVGNLIPLTDLSNVVIDPWRITVPRGAGFIGRPGSRLYASWAYINGFPVTTLTQPAVAGDTTITVADSTGIIAGQTFLTIQDGKWLEQLVPTAVNGNVLTVPELAYPHAVGVGVTDLPEDIKEAVLLLISRLHDTWSLTMNVISMDGGGSKKPPAGPARALCDAAVMLAPYRRVW